VKNKARKFWDSDDSLKGMNRRELEDISHIWMDPSDANAFRWNGTGLCVYKARRYQFVTHYPYHLLRRLFKRLRDHYRFRSLGPAVAVAALMADEDYLQTEWERFQWVASKVGLKTDEEGEQAVMEEAMWETEERAR
jgi:hypothetical protein